MCYLYNGKSYEVLITRKRMKNIRYRYKDGKIYISAPRIVSEARIFKGLDKFAKTLLVDKPSPNGEDFIFLFGYRYQFSSNGGIIQFSNGDSIIYKDKDDFNKKIKKMFLNVVTHRVRYYENLMGLAPHNVKVRDMKTRYGSNSKATRSVTFALLLYHYSMDIIDSVIVHELSHSIVFDHSKAFYSVVFKYCPSYKTLHNKLKKGIFL